MITIPALLKWSMFFINIEMMQQQTSPHGQLFSSPSYTVIAELWGKYEDLIPHEKSYFPRVLPSGKYDFS